MTIAIATAFKNLASKLADVFHEVSAPVRALEEEHAKESAQKVDLATAGPARSDFYEGSDIVTDYHYARGLARYGPVLIAQGALGGGCDLDLDGLTLTTCPPQLPAELQGPLDFDFLCLIAKASGPRRAARRRRRRPGRGKAAPGSPHKLPEGIGRGKK